MNITKQKDHYLFKGLQGAEYHLSHVEYDRLGKTKAIEFVKNELKKKAESSNYNDLDIDFNRARALGFCSFGVANFCDRLNLNPTNTYKLSFLLKKLDVETFLKYPDELIKLFGKRVFDKFGGVIKFLNDGKCEGSLIAVLKSGILSDCQLQHLSIKFAISVLSNFEDKYPNDDRPRNAIEAKLAFIDGKIDEMELIETVKGVALAARAALGAASRAAELSAWAVHSATRLASESEAVSPEFTAWTVIWTAQSASESASESDESSYSAEVEKQIDMVIEELNKREKMHKMHKKHIKSYKEKIINVKNIKAERDYDNLMKSILKLI